MGIGIVVAANILFQGCKSYHNQSENESYPARQGQVYEVSTVNELEQAVAVAGENETILINDGTYELRNPIMISRKSHVTLRGRSGDASKVVLFCGGWEGGNPREGIVVRSSKDITIADITIADARNFGIKIEALGDKSFPESPEEINILRCNFMNIGVRAIKGTAPANRQPLLNGAVRFCRFENTKVPDVQWPFNGDYVSAIDMMYLQDWVFSDNVFCNIRGANGGGRGAIFIWNQSRNIIVERNVFIGCDRSIAFGNPSEPTHYEPGTLHVYDGVIRNNSIVAGTGRGKGIEIVWADNIEISNNSIFAEDRNYRSIHYFQKISNLKILDNISTSLITGEGDASVAGNLTEASDSWFISPALGNLHLSALAGKTTGKGICFKSELTK